MHYNILVFPCGSEIGLEVHRSLKFSRHITLYGANSVDDHGRFVFENYFAGLPFFNEKGFIDQLKVLIIENKIDAIYPAMDAVIAFLKEKEEELGCKVIAPSKEVTETCLSKTKTYELLKDTIIVPKIYTSFDDVEKFPVFLKPDIGYGSRGIMKANNKSDVKNHLLNYPTSLILEYLPGKEYTVDCFSDRNGKLLYFGGRERKRVSNGISVNTIPFNEREGEIAEIVNLVNNKINFSGAWFIQLKENENGELALLEIAARLGGSSSLNRNLGVNFALLSVFNTFGLDIDIFANNFDIELDRALDNKYKLSIGYNTVYCDFDDCLIFGNQVNTQLLMFLFQCFNEKKRLVLVTKHERDIAQTLEKMRLKGIFDEIIHLTAGDRKYLYMHDRDSIFIDDSHVERKEVFINLGIPVFAPDNIECLLK